MIEAPNVDIFKSVRVGVLVSGTGTNLQALIDHSLDTDSNYNIACVISDKPSVMALERASMAGIATYVLSKEPGLKGEALQESRCNEILKIAQDLSIDAFVLAGFLTILTPSLVEAYSNKIINVHPSLLPKFGGKGMYGSRVHQAVLQAGETESGCSVHLVDAGCDTGEVLLQRKVPVLKDDTPDSLAERIHVEEHIAIVEATKTLAKKLMNGR